MDIKILHIKGHTNHGKIFERLIVDPDEDDEALDYMAGNEILDEKEEVELMGIWKIMPCAGIFDRTDL